MVEKEKDDKRAISQTLKCMKESNRLNDKNHGSWKMGAVVVYGCGFRGVLMMRTSFDKEIV